MANSRFRSRTGDLFAIPIDERRVGYGQIVRKTPGGLCWLAVFECLGLVDGDVDSIRVAGPSSMDDGMRLLSRAAAGAFGPRSGGDRGTARPRRRAVFRAGRGAQSLLHDGPEPARLVAG